MRLVDEDFIYDDCVERKPLKRIKSNAESKQEKLNKYLDPTVFNQKCEGRNIKIEIIREKNDLYYYLYCNSKFNHKIKIKWNDKHCVYKLQFYGKPHFIFTDPETEEVVFCKGL